MNGNSQILKAKMTFSAPPGASEAPILQVLKYKQQ